MLKTPPQAQDVLLSHSCSHSERLKKAVVVSEEKFQERSRGRADFPATIFLVRKCPNLGRDGIQRCRKIGEEFSGKSRPGILDSYNLLEFSDSYAPIFLGASWCGDMTLTCFAERKKISNTNVLAGMFSSAKKYWDHSEKRASGEPFRARNSNHESPSRPLCSRFFSR